MQKIRKIMEIDINERIKRLSEIFNSELRYFYLGSMISSDNLVDVESCEKAIEKATFIIEHIDDFVLDNVEDRKTDSRLCSEQS